MVLSDNPTVCLKCAPTYALNNESVCIRCASPCFTCLSNNSSFCLSCSSNYFLWNGSCTRCVTSPTCQICNMSQPLQCTSCLGGFGIGSGVCDAICPYACLICNEAKICEACIPGYSLTVEGVCLPCLTNCSVCASSSQGNCTGCS